ncbi:putative cycloartenol synthase-like [Capsicum annuum]|uniref:FBD domain-containing protein n=1 Tax=Capsicum annuum TaxID=4072 RepID=A0A2G2ZJ79_CAPAN|nr:putative cycloartenol synthase-like [Capsicum annuum]KAF3659831.1 putative cycloartenol synthase-like [Capsicum annuum]PHT81981.1 hypothetical protein T459_14996 [Capsicum annuum]
MEAKALPPSFSNLCNLETLKLINRVSNMVLSPSIWSLVKLRHVDIYNYSVFDSDIDKPIKLENLTTLMRLKIAYLVDLEDILQRFPSLQTLEFCVDCSAEEKIYFPRLFVLTKLETVDVIVDESFPLLEELEIEDYTKIIEILESFGDIASLKFISVWDSPQLEESAFKIKGICCRDDGRRQS